MKIFALMVLLALPCLARHHAYAVACGSSAAHCKIPATISSADGKFTLNSSNQMIVSMQVGTTIEWSVAGVGSSFWVVFPYDPANPIFGQGNPTYFKGDANTPATATVQAQSTSSGAYYAIFALDPNGKPYVLDPKVIVNPGGLGPTRTKRKH